MSYASVADFATLAGLTPDQRAAVHRIYHEIVTDIAERLEGQDGDDRQVLGEFNEISHVRGLVEGRDP